MELPAELARADGYQYQIVNGDLATSAAELRAVVAHAFERAVHAG